ncbi:MAG: class I SAM-dependent methyltransferase [Deltaproteobacteria bacterium]|nr:class I SAM-dependent methyltransferase [Deltaproteobacteria bacterium]MDZ4344699.1 class I SAM-dependent methyltransferase [Candidatus Binatia bacterium]
MAKLDSFDELLNAPASTRKEVAASLYDQLYGPQLAKRAGALPSKRRLKKIALYEAIIGRGHESILEIGCGPGDLTYALVDHAEKVVAIDISATAIELARMRKGLWPLSEAQQQKAEFCQMSAVQLDFPDAAFDWVVSTSVVEHLHPDDVSSHMSEVRRVLKVGGKYLMWCPNGLGHHADREGHLSMMSYGEWMEKLTDAGFAGFRSTLTSRLPMVDARLKVVLESWLWRLKIKLMWSHLGVRNVLIVARK